MADTPPDPAVPAPDAQYVAGRSCAGCTMCCKLMGIAELAKPAQKACPHCTVGVGCKIYETRPAECAAFHCRWLTDARIGEHWAPRRSRMVLAYRDDVRQLTINVDEERPDAWRKAPFRAEIQAWAVAAAKGNGQVLISRGANLIAVLPDREKDLGVVDTDQQITILRREGPNGTEWDAVVGKPGNKPAP